MQNVKSSPDNTVAKTVCVCVHQIFLFYCIFLLYALAPLDRAQVRRGEEVQRWPLRPKLMQLERWKVNEWSRRHSSSLTERVGELGGVIALCSQTLPPSPLCCWPTPAVPLSSWRGRCGSSQKYCPVPCLWRGCPSCRGNLAEQREQAEDKQTDKNRANREKDPSRCDSSALNDVTHSRRPNQGWKREEIN